MQILLEFLFFNELLIGLNQERNNKFFIMVSTSKILFYFSQTFF